MRARKSGRLQLKKALTLLLVLPLTVWGVVRAAPLLKQLASQAALVSAYINMPEGTIAMLEERFNAELLDSDKQGDVIVSEAPPPPSSHPEQSEETSSEQSSASEETQEEEPQSKPAPDVPASYRGKIREVQYGGDSSPIYIPLNAGYLKNSTKLDNSEVQEELDKPLELVLDKTDEPQVLIIHTHATEAYEGFESSVYDTRNTWRSTDNNCNMVRVGERIAQELKAEGIGVIHDDTQHDYPSYNGAYERSAKTVKGYLKKYPGIKVVLDVHRDAIQPSAGEIVKATAEIDGKKAAQVMIITGCEDGSMGVPEWSSNLRFAAALQGAAEESYPGLMRPIFFCYRKYNMDLTTGSILLEFGSHGNTLEEAEYSGELVGKALAQTLKNRME